MVVTWTPQSGRASVCNAWPLGEGGTGEAPWVPAIETHLSSQLEAGAAKHLYIFSAMEVLCSSPRPNPSTPGTSTRDADRAQLCCYIYIYIHTPKWYIWGMPYLTSSNVFSHTLLKKPWNYLEQQHEGEKQVPLRFPSQLCMSLNVAKHQTNTLAQMLKLLNHQQSKLQKLSPTPPGLQFGCSPQKM